jgi:acyl-CoA thioesterase I
LRKSAPVLALALLIGLTAFLFLPMSDSAPHDITLAPQVRRDAPDLRLTVLGTSLTANYDWPDRVADGLAQCLGPRPQITRIAMPGANSDWGLRQIPAVIAAKPDIVLIEFAINDADLRDGVWLNTSAANHRQMILALQAALPDTRVVLLTMSPAQGLRGLIRFRLGRYYLQYQDVARQTGAGLIDLYPRWLALPEAEKGLARDGLHPDPAITAALIVPVITAYLRKAIAGDACDS